MVNFKYLGKTLTNQTRAPPPPPKKNNKSGECLLQIGIEAAVFPFTIQKHKV